MSPLEVIGFLCAENQKTKPLFADTHAHKKNKDKYLKTPYKIYSSI